jgi:Flp pilus assembly pilin Flp
MYHWIARFWLEDDGQDLIEYSLLMTFIAIATMWIMGSGRPLVSAIWHGANTTISQANTTVGN